MLSFKAPHLCFVCGAIAVLDGRGALVKVLRGVHNVQLQAETLERGHDCGRGEGQGGAIGQTVRAPERVRRHPCRALERGKEINSPRSLSSWRMKPLSMCRATTLSGPMALATRAAHTAESTPPLTST